MEERVAMNWSGCAIDTEPFVLWVTVQSKKLVGLPSLFMVTFLVGMAWNLSITACVLLDTNMSSTAITIILLAFVSPWYTIQPSLSNA